MLGFGNARLPKQFKTMILADLRIGESAWTVPWAMLADGQERLWINDTYSAEREAGGTVAMLVTKDEGGYLCDVSRCHWHSWQPCDSACFIGQQRGLAPVLRVDG